MFYNQSVYSLFDHVSTCDTKLQRTKNVVLFPHETCKVRGMRRVFEKDGVEKFKSPFKSACARSTLLLLNKSK